jgi:hypothetical protein
MPPRAQPPIFVEGKGHSWYWGWMKKSDSFADRRQEAEAAKIRRLEKFKARPDMDSPEAVERASARQAQATARAERKAAADLEKATKAAKLKADAAAAAEAKRAAEAQQAKIDAEALETKSIQDEASRKAKRDARYASRKARG